MFVYILASKSRVLYVGVTADLLRRMWEHRTGVKRVAMIDSMNPEWNDLAERWFVDVSSDDPSHPLGVTRPPVRLPALDTALAMP